MLAQRKILREDVEMILTQSQEVSRKKRCYYIRVITKKKGKLSPTKIKLRHSFLTATATGKKIKN